MQLSIRLSLYHPSVRPSVHPPTYPSICWPFPAMLVVRVSVYLPWRPADVYCDGVEYSSYQYGLHQCWISHSGLAGCPPAAYSNIVSRIVIIGAELWPSSLQATEYSQRKPEKKCLCFHFPTKDFIFLRMWILDHGGLGENSDGFGERLHPLQQGGKGGWKDDGKQNPTKAKIRHESVPWSLIHGVLLFSPLSLSLFHPHTYTWESRQLMCCLWWQREAYINSQKTMMKGLRKRKKMARKCVIRKNGNSW